MFSPPIFSFHFLHSPWCFEKLLFSPSFRPVQVPLAQIKPGRLRPGFLFPFLPVFFPHGDLFFAPPNCRQYFFECMVARVPSPLPVLNGFVFFHPGHLFFFFFLFLKSNFFVFPKVFFHLLQAGCWHLAWDQRLPIFFFFFFFSTSTRRLTLAISLPFIPCCIVSVFFLSFPPQKIFVPDVLLNVFRSCFVGTPTAFCPPAPSPRRPTMEDPLLKRAGLKIAWGFFFFLH